MKSSLEIEIKKAIISDVKPFWNFFKKSIETQFPEYPREAKNFFFKKAFPKRNFIKWLKKKERILILVLYKGKIISYLLAENPYGGVALGVWMAVDKKFQGKGIGSMLLKEYEIVAKRKGAHKVYLWSNKRNIKFYKKNRYILVGNFPKSFFKEDHWLFYKNI